MVETHEEILRQKNLPRVGQTVRNRKHGTLWRVMEKREMWQNTVDDPPQVVPAIYLCYWRVKEGVVPGIGRMMGYAYTLHDNTFETNWEVVNIK